MDDEQRREWILERLKHSLQALALPASAQLPLLPDFAVKTDELILDFHHWRDCAIRNRQSEFNTGQLEVLEWIDAQIDVKGTGSSIWNESALYSDPFWEELRVLAKQALDAFGWQLETPPSYAREYIPGKSRKT